MDRRTALVAVISALAVGLFAASPAAATYPGENGKIYFTANAADSSAPDIWSVNPDGSELVNLTDLAGGAGEGYDPSVSGTGSDLAFTTGSQATAEIWTMNADGSSPQQITDDDGIDEQPTVSPDGSRIVFTNWPSFTVRDTWAMNFDGSGQVALIDSSLQQFWPTFTPDGATIALAHETGGNNFDIATSPSSGGPFDTVTLVTSAATEEVNPSVSPDGQRVAFTRWPDGFPIGSMPDVISTDLSGGDEQAIADEATVHESFPAYSPDGTKIVYAELVGDGRLVIANADGSNPQPIPIDPDVAIFENQPDWAVVEEIDEPPPTADDTTPPQTKITKKPKKRIEKRKAKVRFRSNEPGSSFECKLDRKRFKPCDSPRKLKRLKRRKHRFKVRATDAAGNVDPTPAKARFRVLKKR